MSNLLLCISIVTMPHILLSLYPAVQIVPRIVDSVAVWSHPCFHPSWLYSMSVHYLRVMLSRYQAGLGGANASKATASSHPYSLRCPELHMSRATAAANIPSMLANRALVVLEVRRYSPKKITPQRVDTSGRACTESAAAYPAACPPVQRITHCFILHSTVRGMQPSLLG